MVLHRMEVMMEFFVQEKRIKNLMVSLSKFSSYALYFAKPVRLDDKVKTLWKSWACSPSSHSSLGSKSISRTI